MGNGLTKEETATVVAELHDQRKMSFTEISMCFPRSRKWVREQYESHGGFEYEKSEASIKSALNEVEGVNVIGLDEV